MALTEDTPVYFWKPEVENGVFGQWYPSSFVWTQRNETFNYANAEQYASLSARSGLHLVSVTIIHY